MPTRVTLIVPYYECPVFFASQRMVWRAYPAHLRSQLAVIVVDDGSPTQPASKAQTLADPRVRLFRIEQDIRWNWLAARNIGAHEAAEGWLLLTDMDHVVPPETLEAVIYGVHRTDTIYVFSRREHTGTILEPHKNSWLMTRDMFWRVGGYDEALSGRYGSDGEYRQRCAQTAPIAVLTSELIRHEFIGDSSTTRYQRKLPADRDAVRAIINARGPGWRPKVLSFQYEAVPC